MRDWVVHISEWRLWHQQLRWKRGILLQSDSLWYTTALIWQHIYPMLLFWCLSFHHYLCIEYLSRKLKGRFCESCRNNGIEITSVSFLSHQYYYVERYLLCYSLFVSNEDLIWMSVSAYKSINNPSAAKSVLFLFSC